MIHPDYIYIDTAFDGVKNRNNLIKSSELYSYVRGWKTEHSKKVLGVEYKPYTGFSQGLRKRKRS